jgi:ABC-type sugar transport system ATPase subunit
MELIQVQGLVKRYGATTVLDGYDLAVEKGETVVVRGESGCGKTTLLRILAGLETFDRGSVALNGLDVAGVEPHRRGIAAAFQSPALWPHMTLRQNLRFVMEKPEDAIVDRLLKEAEIADLGDRYPAQISGGQAKRASLARALAPQAPILLLDEPLSHLGEEMGFRMLEWVLRETRARGVTTLWVTHDKDEADRLGARTELMLGEER